MLMFLDIHDTIQFAHLEENELKQCIAHFEENKKFLEQQKESLLKHKEQALLQMTYSSYIEELNHTELGIKDMIFLIEIASICCNEFYPNIHSTNDTQELVCH